MLVDRSVRVPVALLATLVGTFTATTGGSSGGTEEDEDADEASDLTRAGGELSGVGSFSKSSARASMGDSTAMKSGDPDGESPSSGKGRCSAKNVSLPTADIPRCRHRRTRTSLGSVRGKSSTTRRPRFRGVRPVGLSSLVASAARPWVVLRMVPSELVAAAFRFSTAADMPDVSMSTRLVADSIVRDVEPIPRCI